MGNETKKILVADDEAPIANVVAMKLRNAGFEVTVALDGQEAYEQAKADRPDFLVTDLQMPGMNGLELCARLAAELEGGVPTILLTAKGFEIDPSTLTGMPIRRVMSKPFSPRELLLTVQEALAAAATT
jgi:two-component system, OmpR family, alkaline phosphatase synthesis response regulator PhoP